MRHIQHIQGLAQSRVLIGWVGGVRGVYDMTGWWCEGVGSVSELGTCTVEAGHLARDVRDPAFWINLAAAAAAAAKGGVKGMCSRERGRGEG